MQRSKDGSCQVNMVKYLFSILILCVLVASCRKENNDDTNLSGHCLQTTLLPTDIPEGFQAVFFLNGKDGFISGSNGGIYKTIDSAKSWTSLNSTVPVPVRDIFFLDASKGFAVGGESSCGGSGCIPYGGFILRTLDGGQTWTRIFTPSAKIEISSIYFINSTTGYCVGNNTIFKTMDGGQTWEEYKINDLGGKMMQIYFTDPQNGYVVCIMGKIVKTTDGGLTWKVTNPVKDIGFYSISGSNGSLYVSGQGKVIKSVDEGSSWSVLSNSPGDIFSIHFVDKNNGFAFGRGNYSGGDFGRSYGSVYCTSNGGKTWNGNGDIKEVGAIVSVSFPAHKIGYGISGNLVIRITKN